MTTLPRLARHRSVAAIGLFGSLFIALLSSPACKQSEPGTLSSEPGQNNPDGGVQDAAADGPRYVGQVLCGDIQASPDACGACASEACCSEAQACADDDDCRSIVQCLRRCTLAGAQGSACADGCISDHAVGWGVLEKLDACSTTKCADSCQGDVVGGIDGANLDGSNTYCKKDNSCSDPRCADCDGYQTNACETDLSTSRAHCGSCTKICDSGQTCLQYSCISTASETGTVLTSDAAGATTLAVGGGFVYYDPFTTMHSLRRVAISGGTSSLVDQLTSSNVLVAADSTHVYWAQSDALSRQAHGGTTEPWYTTSGFDSVDISLFQGVVYLTAFQSTSLSYVLAASGPAAPTVLQNSPVLLGPISVDSSGIYEALSVNPAEIGFVPAGSPPFTPVQYLPNQIGIPNRIIADGDSIYVVHSPAQVMVSRLDKTSSTRLDYADPAAPGAKLTLSPDSVFYPGAADSLGRTPILRVPRDGGASTVFAVTRYCSDLVYAQGWLYWIDLDAGTGNAAIRRAPVP